MEKRYSRQEVYDFIGKKGQKKLLSSKVTIIGLGAIGSQVSSLLARAGIGHLILIDRDTIELSNLQRQALFNESDVGKPKAVQAKINLQKINSTIRIDSFDTDVNNDNIATLLAKADVILDCTDNMETRFLINDFALKNKIPWIYAGAIQSTAFIMNIIPGKTPCYSCVFSKPASLATCETSGVLGTSTSLVASLQVSEAIKILLEKNYAKELIHINLETNAFDKFKIKKRKDCPACEGHYLFLNALNPEGILKFCSSGNYQIPLKNVNLRQLKASLAKIDAVQDLETCLHFKNMLIFPHRCLIKAKSEAEAKSLVSKYIGN